MNTNNSLIIPANASKSDDNIIHAVLEPQKVDSMLYTSQQKPSIDTLKDLLNRVGEDSELTIKIRHKKLNQPQPIIKPTEHKNNNNDDLSKYYPEYEDTVNIPVWQISAVVFILILLLVVVVK